MPLTLTITLERLTARPAISMQICRSGGGNSTARTLHGEKKSRLIRLLQRNRLRAALPLRKAGALLLLACTVGQARAAIGIVNAAMMTLCRKRLFATTGLFCKFLVKLEPSQCRDLASANQANPSRLPKQASALGFRAILRFNPQT